MMCDPDEPYLFKICPDGMLRRCIPNEDIIDVLRHCHRTMEVTSVVIRRPRKCFKADSFGQFKDAHHYAKSCDKCQRFGSISKRHEMPLQKKYEVEFLFVKDPVNSKPFGLVLARLANATSTIIFMRCP